LYRYNTAEGGIRSDKGTKADQEKTPAEYLSRVMGLAKLEWQLLTLAIITTLITSGAALFVPHFQGSAFDAAISLDADLFNRQASLLLASSMAVVGLYSYKLHSAYP
jgi:ABC-type multidrug transport system fused ATPase/permease subunit